ncbi:MAG: alpha-L-arabinofuranosidase C-terminal domain-containing protein [Armatimonadota bacterium]
MNPFATSSKKNAAQPRLLLSLMAIVSIGATVPTAATAQAPAWKMTVSTDKPGAKINPHFYGIMTEEINHAYDGGLYAELIQNRSFRDDVNAPVHWTLVQDGGATGTMGLVKTGGVTEALNVSLKLDTTVPGTGRVGIANDGFWGIPVKPNTTYSASFYAKSTGSGPIALSLESSDGKTVFAAGQTGPVGRDWKKYSLKLKTGKVPASLNNRFVVSTKQSGTTHLSFVSLFPPTYKNRPNGNRIDLMQKIGDMKPKFLRFPGGNYVDPGHYEWKKTIGPLENRPLGRREWGYPSSYGLGILEFMHWCEDLNMEPVLDVTVGRSWLPADGDVTPLVQDALDEIEYLTGDVNTPWGKRRAADGHPTPLKLRFVEIGNEDFFDRLSTYNARFAKFYDAIRAKYPKLIIISTRPDVSSRRPDLIDDHIYASVSGMRRASANYDNYDRKRPKVFVGEWATIVGGMAANNGSPTPMLEAALSDATYLLGLERNADVIEMACYAPLLVNVNPGARQWSTNLIGYDALTSFGSTSYYMQKMFAANKGDVVLPTSLQKTAPTATTVVNPKGAVGVGTWRTQAEFKDARVTQGGRVLFASDFTKPTTDWKFTQNEWKAVNGVLAYTGDRERALATIGNPEWTDYTFTVKARKTGGAEGFLIPFHVEANGDLVWWNIGGWGNTRSALQKITADESSEFGNSDVTVETGRWYDIKIEVEGPVIRCYLDGKLITEARDMPPTAMPAVYAGSTRDLKTGDVILKVVNFDGTPQSVQIELQGASSVNGRALGQVLTGKPTDINSVENPTKIVPQAVTITNVGKNFTHSFAPHSVTVVRLKTR